MLSLSCRFFKELFSSIPNTEVPKIVLPYSSDSVQAFVQFFYAGEVLITENVASEFASLCHEFNMNDEIPVIRTMIENHKIKEDSEQQMVSITISQVEVPKIEDSAFDDYFQTNEHVETIFFNEEQEFPADRDGDMKKADDAIKEEQYMNVQFIDDNPNFEQIEAGDKTEPNEGSTEQDEIPQTPEFLENLEMAAEEVRKGMSFWNAHK